MSNYFQVLKRIEKDRSDGAAALPATDAAAPVRAPVETRVDTPVPPPAPQAPAPTLPPSPAATAPVSTAAPHAPRPLRALSAARPVVRSEDPAPLRQLASALSGEGQRGIATLFDNIRALASGRATRTLVFAGAVGTNSVHAVTEGLAQHARRHGMTVFVATLTRVDGSPTLTARTSAASPETPNTLALDLKGGATPGELNAWVDRTAATSDLVLLEAPSLADSIDAALLACACDGLVIVADAEVTPRGALQVAAERSQIAGCRTLGVVMNGTKERVPSWMRRLTGGS